MALGRVFHFLSRDERRGGTVELVVLARVDRLLGAAPAGSSASCFAVFFVFLPPPSFGGSSTAALFLEVD